MASNGVTSNPEEYLKAFPEIGSQRRRIMENGINNESIEDETFDEVEMCMDYIYIYIYMRTINTFILIFNQYIYIYYNL